MIRTPVTSAAMESRLETTLDEFNVVSDEERVVLKNSLLRLQTLKRNKGVSYSPKDERTAALLTVYQQFTK